MSTKYPDNIQYKNWIPALARSSFQSIDRKDKLFIKPLFVDDRAEEFWLDFSTAGRFFFSEIYMHLLHCNARFDKYREEHKKLTENGYDLRDREQALITAEKKLFKNFISDGDGDIERHSEQKYNLARAFYEHEKSMAKLNNKNPMRPRNRESFNLKYKEEKKIQFLGVGLYYFFEQEHIQADWKKNKLRLKKHVCAIVNVLINERYEATHRELTVSQLTIHINNFRKKSITTVK